MKTIELPSTLYPFRRDDLTSFHYRQYTLENVFSSISESQREACIELWLRNKVLPSREAALHRSSQVCYMITDTESGTLIGVNTLYPDQLEPGGPEFYFYRMFIDSVFRNSRLMITGTTAALCFAKLHLANTGKLGVININENTKLAKNGMQRLFIEAGYKLLGQLNGQDVWVYRFDSIDFMNSNSSSS